MLRCFLQVFWNASISNQPFTDDQDKYLGFEVVRVIPSFVHSIWGDGLPAERHMNVAVEPTTSVWLAGPYWMSGGGAKDSSEVCGVNKRERKRKIYMERQANT